MANTYRHATTATRPAQPLTKRKQSTSGGYREVVAISRDQLICECPRCWSAGQLIRYARLQPLEWPVLCEVHARSL